MTIVFPSLPYQNRIDPMWEPERDEARRRGYPTVLYDTDEPRLYGTVAPGERCLYRGWMLDAPTYGVLSSTVPLLTSLGTYMTAHSAKSWYPKLHRWTFRSHFKTVPLSLSFDNNESYFVKGDVKSFGKESFIHREEDLATLYNSHELRAGEELFVREYEWLVPDSERRYFVFDGEHGVDATGKDLPEEIAHFPRSFYPPLFYSVDIALRASQHPRHPPRPVIVEVGDGQVSDLKEWELEAFYDLVIARLGNKIR